MLGFEFDYLPVGNGSSSGDAIIIKFGNLHSGRREDYKVVVIDGGTLEAGEAVVKHIIEFTGDNVVDLVVVTHCDNDHVSGVESILRGCAVLGLVMHRPWAINKTAALVKSLARAKEIDDLAMELNVPLFDPLFETEFFGGVFKVLGPSLEYYLSLIGEFDKPKQMLKSGVLSNKVRETEDSASETLDGTHKYTSPTNNSSVITYFELDNKRALFTGDAGIEALALAIVAAQQQGIDLSKLDFFHVPHHGSQHNLTTGLIDYFNPSHSFVSASAEAEKHPHPRVTNAFKRRKLRVYATNGKGLRHHHNAPARPNWSSASQVPFIYEFED